MSSSSSSSASHFFSFPALTVSDDGKESYPPSLFSSSQPNYRTINALPSPSSSSTTPFAHEPTLYRSTATLSDDLDDAEPWAQPTHPSLARKQLTLSHIQQANELPAAKLSQLPEVRVAPREGGWQVRPLPAVIEGEYSLASPRGGEEVMSAVLRCVEAYGRGMACEAEAAKGRVCGVFYDAFAPVQFQVNVFSAEGFSLGSTVVEVQRRAGDQRAFHSFFLALHNQLIEAGVVDSEGQQPRHPMESMSPPAFDDDDDAALDLAVQELYKAKAHSLHHADAREGLLGLLTSPAPLPLCDACPLVQRALDAAHDAEQQRLAFALLQRSLEDGQVARRELLQPVLPALFECVGELPQTYASAHAARSLASICDSCENDIDLAPLVAEQAELVGQVRQMASMVKA